MSNTTDTYLKSIQEGYVLDNKTISCDLSKFESGKSNVLLIAGLSAAGKTTLGRKLEKKYNAKLFRTDWCLSEKISIDKKQYKDSSKCYRDSFNIVMKSNKRYILEGILVYWSCIDNNRVNKFFSQCEHTPTIILGTSIMKTFWRGWQREKSKQAFRDIYDWYVKKGISDQKLLNIFRQERKNVPGTEIKKYKI